MSFKQQLIKSLKELTVISRGSGGEKFEKIVENLLEENLGFRIIDSKHFKEIYPEYKSISKYAHLNEAAYDFTKVKLSSGIKNSDNLIVIQPNGSQSSPDILIIHNKIGYPIEIKSSKEGKILWNSGYPRKNYLYIYNCYKKHKKTTYFLGQDIITDEEKKILFEASSKNKIIANNFNSNLNEIESKWSIYARPMFNSNIDYFNIEDLNFREKNVIDYIENLNII